MSQEKPEFSSENETKQATYLFEGVNYVLRNIGGFGWTIGLDNIYEAVDGPDKGKCFIGSSRGEGRIEITAKVATRTILPKIGERIVDPSRSGPLSTPIYTEPLEPKPKSKPERRRFFDFVRRLMRQS